jgi:tripartite-type tricarboxylate transporter receptor subunit TctC
MRVLATLALCALAIAPAARADDSYPSRPVTIVVGFPPGTATDTVARPLAESFTQSMGGARFIVENRTGQSGSIGAASVARSTPDGYTIFIAASAPLVINPHVYPNLRYDSRADFAPVGQILQFPFVLVTGRDTRYRGMRDVVESAKSAPNAISYSTPGNGTTSHLIMSMLIHATGAKLNHVPYRGTAQSITDIAAGRVDVTFETVVGSLPFIRDGLVRPLAVTAEGRSSLLPDVPTTSEAGFPDARGGAWLGMFGPAGIPPSIVAKLNGALRTALADEKMLVSLRALGAEPDPTSPEEMGAILRRDYDRWGEIVRVTGVRAD